MKPEMKIEVLRPSASRPDLLRRTHEEFLKRVHYSGGFLFGMHEDVLQINPSIEALQWAIKTGYFTMTDDPPVGQGNSLRRLILTAKSKYIFQFEDDWLFLRDIDLDQVIQIMEENPEVNQICFHKRPIMEMKGPFKKEQVSKSGFPLVVSPHWNFLPAVWRLSYIQPFFAESFGIMNKNFAWQLNEMVKQIPGGAGFRDHEWMKANVGAYFFGKHGEETYIKHLGIVSARLGELS